MIQEQPRGKTEPSLFGYAPDRRVSEIDQYLREHDPLDQLGVRQIGDPYATLQAQYSLLSQQQRIYVGQVIHAVPGLNWYRVQLSSGHGSVGACALDQGGLGSMGPRTVGMYPAGTPVMVYKPHGVAGCYIIGALPTSPPTTNAGPLPDWLTQGGGSGYKVEPAHHQAIVSMFQGGGVQDYSAGRPLDQTQFDRGIISSTGIGLLVNDAETYLRVNELCGIFFNLADSHARLAGIQLDIVSWVHEESARCDEGESRYFTAIAMYPWEALGLYGRADTFINENTPSDVQYGGDVGAFEPVEAQGQPIYRYQEYGGYFGNMRLVMLPQGSGRRTYDDGTLDLGLFRETIAGDGSYSAVSAKSYYIGKRCKIAVPREIAPPEHASGDDARADNYKFSNTYGGGDPHLVPELIMPVDDTSAFRIAAVMDELVHQINWKGLHAFFYHGNDFQVPNEDDDSVWPFNAVQDVLDFDVLNSKQSLPDPVKVALKIDERYDNVDYYERESFITLLDDGSVMLGCGFGASVILTQGRLRLEAPGDIEILAGRRLLVLSAEGIMRCHQSIDISSANGDVRIKAENNLQVLAGNSGTGGVLIESKGVGADQDYHDKIGEKVVGAGIVLKTQDGVLATISDSLYMLTLGDDGMTLDSNNGTSPIGLYGLSVNVFATDGLAVWLPVTTGHAPSFERAHLLSDIVVLDACVTIRGATVITGDDAKLVVAGSIAATEGIISCGRVSDSTGSTLGRTPVAMYDSLLDIAERAKTCVTNLEGAAGDVFQQVTALWYDGLRPGNTEVIDDLGFSYRDDEEDNQYHTDDGAAFTFLEPRWQQMVRFGLALGGTEWIEPLVDYHDLELYPWPGKDKWLDDDRVFLQLAEHKLVANNGGKALGGDYELADLGDWNLVTMSTGFKTIY